MHFANVAFNLSFHSNLEEILQQVYIVPPKIMKYSQRWGTKIIFCYINVRPNQAFDFLSHYYFNSTIKLYLTLNKAQHNLSYDDISSPYLILSIIK